VIGIIRKTRSFSPECAYYLVRGLSVAAAPLLGGLLWVISPTLTFGVAAVFGILGALWYIWRGLKSVA